MSVEVIALVLDATSHEFLTFDNDLLAVQVGALAAGIPGALSRVPQVRNRQAAFVTVLILVFAQGNDTGLST